MQSNLFVLNVLAKHDAAETDGLKKRKVDVFSLATRELPPPVTSGLLFTLVKRRALIGWRKRFIRLKYIMLYLDQTG